MAPVRVAPGAIADLQAHRNDERIQLRFTVPAANQDRTVPSLAERVEVYRVLLPASAPPPAAAALIIDKNLLVTVPVDRDARSSSSSREPAQRPYAPGDVAIVTDKIEVPAPGTADIATRHYVAVAVAGRSRRGAPSPVVSVVLGQKVAAPADVKVAYDEKSLRLQWPALPPGTAVVIDEVISGAAGKTELKRLTPQPLTANEFLVPIEFGRHRCFAVRSVETTGSTTAEGAPGTPVCETPIDRFAPPAPARLTGIPGSSGVDLNWAASEATDVAGYVVLRGEGPGGTLQPLMTNPIAAASFRDAQVKPGVTYIYAVVALDKSGNISPQSNHLTVTVR